MKCNRMRTALFLPAIFFAGAIGLALQPSTAMAQASQGEAAKDAPAAAAGAGNVLGGVVVQAPRAPSKAGDIPPDKRAAFDEEASKNEAWKRYRKSTPPLADGTLGLAKDYPGLQSLLPPPDETAPAAPAAR